MNQRVQKVRAYWNFGKVFLMVFAAIWMLVSCEQPAAAAGKSVVVRNHAGEEMKEVQDGYYESLNEVFFCLNEEELEEGEIFVYSASIDGGENFGSLNPVEENQFVCAPAEELTDGIYQVRFYRYHVESRKQRELLEGEKTYLVDFYPKNANSLQVKFEHEEGKTRDGILYLTGSVPELSVCPAGTGKTFLTHETEESTITYDLGSEEMQLRLSEGYHKLQLWVELADGSSVAAEDFPMSVCYDPTPPSDPVFSISMNGGHLFSDMKEYQCYGNGTLGVHLESLDETSGIDRIQVEYGKDRKAEGEDLIFQAPFSGEIRAKAIDIAGNESPWVVCYEKILLEKEAPEIEIEKSENQEEIMFEVHLKDENAGLWRVDCKYGDKTLYDEEFGRREKRKKEYDFTMKLPREDIRQEEQVISVMAVDNAGNETTLEIACSKTDTAAPDIRFSGCTNFQVTRDDVEILVEVEDENLDRSKLKMEAVCMDEKGKILEIIPLTNERNRFMEEGNYSLMIKAEDTFGNVNSDILSFIIDRSAPEINGLQEYDGKYLQEFALDKNVSEMMKDDSMITYHLFLNGEDYDESIPVTKQGKHSLYVQAVDEVGNESEARAEFIIDSEAPKILLYEKKSELQIKLGEADDYMEYVTIDGKEVLSKKEKSFSYVLSKPGTYQVEVRAADLAGNSTKISRQITIGKTEKITVSKNMEIISSNQAPRLVKTEEVEKNFSVLWWLAAIVMILGFVAFIWWKWKRSEIDTPNEV